MRTRLSFLKASVCIAVVLLADHTTIAKSCLWKANSDTDTLYVLGSIHLLKADDYPLSPAIQEAYAKCDAVVLETDMQAMVSPDTQSMIMQKAMLEGDITLESLLDRDVYEAVAKEARAVALPMAALAKFKPWFAGMTLTMTHLQKLGFDPHLGIDNHLHDRAFAGGKSTLGLETVRFQIDLIDSLSEENPNDFMRRTLKDLQLADEKVGEIVGAWKEGNLSVLHDLMHESFEEFPKLYDRFVTARNKVWANQLDDMIRKHSALLVVVGAAHLPGEEGLLKLLEKRGYTLEQL